MISVILFGSVPLATWAAERVRSHSGLCLAGLVCQWTGNSFSHHNLDYPCVFDYATANGVPMFDLYELPSSLDPDTDYLGLSVRFSQIIGKETLDLFRLGVLNLHGGMLPGYRGTNIANHVILACETEAAGTLHFIDEGIDTGPIVDREVFPVLGDDRASDVFQKIQDALMRVFEKNLDVIARGDIPATPQQVFIDRGELARIFHKADLTSEMVLDLSMPSDEIDRRVRAFDFPRRPSAYFVIEGRKYHVSKERPADD